VAVYGGFSDQLNTCSVDDRDWILHPTILSGDIGVLGNASDNSHRVVTATNVGAASILDGFTVRDGSGNNNGAGMAIQATAAGALSSPRIANCVLVNNFTPFKGGAAYVFASAAGAQANPHWENVIFEQNNSTSDGGAMILIAQTGGTVSMTMDSCLFQNNTAGQRAGAIVAWANGGGVISANFTETDFIGNSAALSAGAYWNYCRQGAPSTSSFENCSFVTNTSTNAGAILNQPLASTGTINLLNCSLAGNSATGGRGGAVMQQFNNAVGTVGTINASQCSFEGNTSTAGGGAFSQNSSMTGANNMTANANFDRCRFAYNFSGTDGAVVNSYATGGTTIINNRFVNCIFQENEAARFAGVIYAHSLNGSSQQTNTFHSTTSYRNQAVYRGGFGYLDAFTAANSVSMRVTNGIFFGDGTPATSAPFNLAGAFTSASLSNCLLTNVGCAANFTGQANYTCTDVLSGNPLFADPNAGDFSLLTGSPAIDAGTAVQAPNVDFLGNARPVGAGFDIGAMERQAIGPRWAEQTETSGFSANVFPNPTTGAFALVFDRPLSATVQLFDAQGRLVSQMLPVLESNRMEISLEGVASGAYLVRIVSGETVQTLTVLLKKP
jgi:hypothetical protein